MNKQNETKTYDVKIQATIRKTITVEAEDEDSADEQAQEMFSPLHDGKVPERYEQETLSIEETK